MSQVPNEPVELSYAGTQTNTIADLRSADRLLAARLVFTIGVGFIVLTMILLFLTCLLAGPSIGNRGMPLKGIGIYALMYVVPALILILTHRGILGGGYASVIVALIAVLWAIVAQGLVIIGSGVLATLAQIPSIFIAQIIVAGLFTIAMGKLTYHLIRVLIYRGSRGKTVNDIHSVAELFSVARSNRVLVGGAVISLVLSTTTAILALWAWNRSCTLVPPPPGDPVLLNPAPMPAAPDWEADCHDPQLGLAAKDRAFVIAAIEARQPLHESIHVGLDSLLREVGLYVVEPAVPPLTAASPLQFRLTENLGSGRNLTLSIEFQHTSVRVWDHGVYSRLHHHSRPQGHVDNGGVTWIDDDAHKLYVSYAGIEAYLKSMSVPLTGPLTAQQAQKLSEMLRTGKYHDMYVAHPIGLPILRTVEDHIVEVSAGPQHFFLTPDGREISHTPAQLPQEEIDRVAASEPTPLLRVSTPVVASLTISGILGAAGACFALFLAKTNATKWWRLYAVVRILLAVMSTVVWLIALTHFDTQHVAFWPAGGILNPLVLLSLLAAVVALYCLGFWIPWQLLKPQAVASEPLPNPSGRLTD